MGVRGTVNLLKAEVLLKYVSFSLSKTFLKWNIIEQKRACG
jgi:hypothetical protein